MACTTILTVHGMHIPPCLRCKSCLRSLWLAGQQIVHVVCATRPPVLFGSNTAPQPVYSQAVLPCHCRFTVVALEVSGFAWAPFTLARRLPRSVAIAPCVRPPCAACLHTCAAGAAAGSCRWGCAAWFSCAESTREYVSCINFVLITFLKCMHMRLVLISVMCVVPAGLGVDVDMYCICLRPLRAGPVATQPMASLCALMVLRHTDSDCMHGAQPASRRVLVALL